MISFKALSYCFLVFFVGNGNYNLQKCYFLSSKKRIDICFTSSAKLLSLNCFFSVKQPRRLKVELLTLRFSYLEKFSKMLWRYGSLLNIKFRSIAYHIYVFFLKISSSILKIYSVLLIWLLEDISEVAVCRHSK